MPEEKIWHYKGLVRPVAGYSGPPCQQGALLVVVRARGRLGAESKIYELMIQQYLTEMGDKIFEETDGVPQDLPPEVQSTYREAIELGQVFHFQAFR